MSYIRSKSFSLAEIADCQHGRITRAQLLGAGVDTHRIRRWLADGRLRRVHQGVYALGHMAPSMLGDYMAAVLAGGPGACLSHRPAAHLSRLTRGPAPAPEITIAPTACRNRPGITIHRAALDRLDVFELHGILITSIPRILLDLAPSLPPAEVRAALAGDVTLSQLETAFLRLLASHGLPPPRTNIDRAGDKVDCHWPDVGLTIELLSYRYHGSRYAFETDVARRRRSNHIAYTWGDVTERSAQTAAEVAARLSA